MSATNTNEPLRTTEHQPSAAPPAAEVTTDAAPDASVVAGRTGAYVPGQGAVPTVAAPEREQGTVSVPGYEIEGVLGRGGMGVVYKARHLALKRTVALKMVLAGGHAGPGELARFRIEAEAAARLQHPNIVQIHEVGAADGHPYCALEFVEGGNLADKIKGKPLSAREAAKLVEALGRAMQLAHSRNVVHRDLKPANILLSPLPSGGEGSGVRGLGTPKITDFGLARQLDSDSGETQAGQVMGTPSYMAPEQASGHANEAGPAADIYALGAILYDCLAGRPPFKGKTVVETLDQVRTQEPAPPSRWQAGVPLDLDTICLKCLCKEPEKRYASAAELADDLHRFQRGEPILARPVGRIERGSNWVKRNPVVTLAAAVVVLTLAVATPVTYLKYLDAKEQERLAKQNATEAETARGEEAKQRQAAEEARGKADDARKEEAKQRQAAQDATRKEAERVKERDYQLGISDFLLSAAAFDNPNHDVYLVAERLDKVPQGQRGWEWAYLKQQNCGGLFTLHGHTLGVYGVSFSPDGTRIVTGCADGTAKVWDARRGTSLLDLKGHKALVRSVNFSPDGARIVTGSHDKTARVWDARTGTLLLDLKGHTDIVTSVNFSPDGTRIVTGSGDKTVKVWDAHTGKPLLEVKEPKGPVTSVSFSPDGTRIATSSLGGGAKVWDARTGAPLLDLGGIFYVCVSFSPDGARIAVSYRFGSVVVFDARTSAELLDLRAHANGVTSVSFSPDGTRIVTGSDDRTANVWDARTGASLLELKGHTDMVTSVSFSPDAAWIVTGSADKTAKVWDARTGTPRALDLEGPTSSVSFSARIFTSGGRTAKVWDARTGMPVLDVKAHTNHTNQVEGVSFSPDGARIATSGWVFIDNSAKVWNMHGLTLLLDLKARTSIVPSVRLSGLGALIAVSKLDGRAKVWDARTGTLLFDLKGHTGAVNSVSFSPDGTRIVTGGDDKTAKVWDARTGTPLLDLKGHTSGITSVSFSPDGTQIVTGGGGGTKLWDAGTGPDLKSDRPLDAKELDRRWYLTRPNDRHYAEDYDTARKAKDDFAARFYLDRLLALPRQRTTERFRDRNALLADPLLSARTSSITPPSP